MSKLILEPTPVAQWRALVTEARSACDYSLDESLESYLVFLLMRFTGRTGCTTRIMATDYLQSQTAQGEQQFGRLRDVGDHCLLFSGLFPQLAERRHVNIGYFVRIGRSSYLQLSERFDQGRALLYGHLAETFVILMDILQAMREIGGQPLLSPLEVVDLWEETGSRRCYASICAGGDILPAPGSRKFS